MIFLSVTWDKGKMSVQVEQSVSTTSSKPVFDKLKTLRIEVEKYHGFSSLCDGKISVTRAYYGDGCTFSYNPSNFEHTLKSNICCYGLSQKILETMKEEVDRILLEIPILLQDPHFSFQSYELNVCLGDGKGVEETQS